MSIPIFNEKYNNYINLLSAENEMYKYLKKEMAAQIRVPL